MKLPREADDLLGLPAGHGRVMKLIKPKALKMGKGAIMQHPLDGCLFLAFDKPIQLSAEDGGDPPRLIAIFGLHVDDLLGCCDERDPSTRIRMDKLRSTFNFREWHSGADKDELTYCGAKIIKLNDDHWNIHHTEYMGKQKSISFPKGATTEDPTSYSGGTISPQGFTRCPAMAEHPNCNQYAGGISDFCHDKHLLEANKVLRRAKQHTDLGLEFRNLGKKEDVTFIAFSDASFACRPDNSSLKPRWLSGRHGRSCHCRWSRRPLQRGGLAKLEVSKDCKIHTFR